MDLVRRRVRRDDSEVDLTEPEAVLLAELLKSDRFVERDVLQRAVWGGERRGARALDGIVVRLRQKLERDPSTPEIIKTTRGEGYRLQRPDPVQQAGLLGRDALIAEIAAAHRRPGLTLLLGFAGIGKSSLARVVAPDALWIDLAAATSARDASRIAAAALDIPLRSQDPVEQVGAAIAQRADTRIILDNLEKISDVKDLLSRWLALAPRARWLATSRVRTRVDEERVIDVGPLSLAAATSLFVQHAQRASSTSGVLRADDPLVAEIVERLDRIPLAITFAAARTAVLDLGALRDRLAARALELSQPSRAARHPSLDLAVQDSLSGLTAPERDALYALSMFGSRFDIEDAEALLGPDAIDLLQALRDRSLLRRLPSGGFGLWQVVRETLSGSVPDPIVRRWIEHLARWGGPELLDGLGFEGSDEDVACLIRQMGDIERACRLALARGETDLAARCASAVVWASVTQGPYPLGVELAEAVLAALPSSAVRARLLCELGALRVGLGQWDKGLQETSEAFRLASETGESALEIRARLYAAGMAREIHGNEAARNIVAPTLGLASRPGLPGGMSAWCHAAMSRYSDQPEEERRWLRIAAHEARDAGDRALALRSQLFIAETLRHAGELSEAKALFVSIYETCDRPQDQWARMTVLKHILVAFIYTGDADGAHLWAQRYLDLSRRLGSRVNECQARLQLAQIALDVEGPKAVLAKLDAIEQDLGASPGFAEIACDVELFRAQLSRDIGAHAASIRALERGLKADNSAVPQQIAVWMTELAMSQIAAGALAEARATFERAPPGAEINQIYRLAQAALLACAEGKGLELAAVRAEAERIGTPLPSDDTAAMIERLGPWVADVIAASLVGKDER